MGKKKIIEAAKRKGISVEWIEWIEGVIYSEWQIEFGDEVGELYEKDIFQAFMHTAAERI